MPRIYLSPSTQEGNMYVTGGSEEYYMNLVADAMVRYLQANAIQFTRNSCGSRGSVWDIHGGRCVLFAQKHKWTTCR